MSYPRIISTLLVVFASIAASALAQTQTATLAPTPPMGWNSWDAYGLTINEADFKANAAVLASIKQYGWQYAVIDEGWYLEDPFATRTELQKFVIDSNGRLIPALNRFPSAANGAGLKPIADWVHGQGLKFGIHLIRGIPRVSLRDDRPIAGSPFKASDAADTTDVCSWNQDNYGIRDNAAGQAWYDSLISLYAGWGIDFLKVDCIADHPYKITEIRQIAAAIKKTGRPIVLSLSPGPTAFAHADEIAKYAQLWRLSDDHWDVWSHVPHAWQNEFPMSTMQAFDRLAAWQPYVSPGHWPDEDMLPIGSLMPHPGWGKPRESRFTHDEARTEFTLWAISRSPLILGGNLTRLDDFTRSLITNKEVTAMNQKAVKAAPVNVNSEGWVRTREARYWWAETKGPKPVHYLAIFNISNQANSFDAEWQWFLLPDTELAVYDIWNDKHIPAAKMLHAANIPAHGCALFRVE